MVMMYGSVGRWKDVQSIFVGTKFELMLSTLFLNSLLESVFFVIVCESTYTATSMTSNVMFRAVHGGIFSCKDCAV